MNEYKTQTLEHLGLVSSMIDELGIVESIDNAIAIPSQLNLLYSEPSQIITPLDPVVEEFNAFDTLELRNL